MGSFESLPWMKINDFLVDVGSMREPKQFCIQLIKKIYALIPYDQARIYFVDNLGKVYDEVLIGVEKRWSDVYLEYFSKFDNGRYSIPSRTYQGSFNERTHYPLFPKLEGGIHDWTQYTGANEFITEYIKPQGLKHSAGFGLHNVDNFTKSVYIIDRTSRSGYNQEEIGIMNIIQPHLDNLHKNMFVLTQSNTCITKSNIKDTLSKRELEIAKLLCDGLTPSKISRRLFISLSTVYRHIANIHKKLEVSNRQELLIKLMDD